MGKVAPIAAAEAANNRKRKKKGRPSLLDLQKRSLRLQQKQQQNPILKNPNSIPLNPDSDNSTRRSARRNPNPDGIYEDDDEDERKEKKLKLVEKLPPLNPDHLQQRPRSSAHPLSLNSASHSNAVSSRSAYGSADKGEKVSKATDTPHGSRLESGPTTPLPDKKLLVFILDRLQKKDTYGVFSEPVDSNELPDYHEIIEHPMDFGTVRKRLDDGLYSHLEQFEADVHLICENAMQYNSADTIYFRQARSMQELAKKDFENLRQDSDDSESQSKAVRRGDDSDSQPKVARRGRPPKNQKKPIGGSPSERAGPECSSDATLASAEDNTLCGSSYNLRKGPIPCKLRSMDASAKASNRSRSIDTYLGFSEAKNDFSGSVSIMKAASMKHTSKQFTPDECRRDTYRQYSPSFPGYETPVFTALDDGLKRLTVVGLHSEHAYARSLARFAANLGPVVWKIASKKLQSVLPAGTKFGPGWVEEQESPPKQSQPYEKPCTSSSSVLASGPPLQGKENAAAGLHSQSKFPPSDDSGGGIKSVLRPDMNGFRGGVGFSVAREMGMTKPPVASTSKCTSEGASTLPRAIGTAADSSSSTLVGSSSRAKHLDSDGTDESHGSSSGGAYSGHIFSPGLGPAPHGMPETEQRRGKQESLLIPPDLNVRFRAPGIPNSTLQANPSEQPDLALQL